MMNDIFNETPLGPLPNNWIVTNIGELARIKYGKANPKSKGVIPMVGSGGIFDWTNVQFVDFPTIVIGRKGTAGKAWLMEGPSYPSDTTFFLDWKRDVDIQFLYSYLILDPLSGEHAKTTLPSLTRSDLENKLIPLPPLPEQRAIARVLSTVRQAIESTEQVIAAARELKRSLMKYLFTYGPVPIDQADQVVLKETEIGTMPEEWEVLKIGEFAATKSGGTPSREQLGYFQGNIPWVKSGELENSHIDLTEEYITEGALANSSAKIFPVGTLLVAMYGATAGKVGILEIEAATNQAVCAIFPDGNAVSDYLFYSLMYRREDLLGERYGGAQPNISQQVVRSFCLPIPPVEQQNIIYSIMDVIDNKIAIEIQQKKALESLFNSLLHHLMTGKLRVQPTPSPSQLGGELKSLP